MRYFLILFLFYNSVIHAQIPGNWQHLDPEKDTVLGISTYRAFEYLKNKPSDTVTVAIIDNGADISHEDLQGRFWVNRGEIKNNGIDDDHNGFVDDTCGWNFLGNPNGEDMKYGTVGITRVYAALSNKFENKDTTNLSGTEHNDFQRYKQIEKEFDEALAKKHDEIDLYTKILNNVNITDSILSDYFKNPEFTEKEVDTIQYGNDLVMTARDYKLRLYHADFTQQRIESILKNLNNDLATRLNPKYNGRAEIVGDNPDDITDSIYGNNHVNARGPNHGTSVASIVGGIGDTFPVMGVARKVKLMIIRIVPNGDEQDKDVALAIKYAVRNGAQVINCSFAKRYGMHPEFVDEAMHLAEQKGVLIVHAAGNDGIDNDSVAYDPSGYFMDSIRANNWINVGASLPKDNENLAADFSNYGAKSVDVFAPGYALQCCGLHNSYETASGTSLAAPVVTGMAAVLKSYYPKLTASQLKDIIIKSAYIPKTSEVFLPGSNNERKVKFSTLSVSGGVANLYRAVLLAEKEYSK